MKGTPFLAALLMLGGVSFAYAQEGPNEGARGTSERGSSNAQERSKGSDAGVGERSHNSDAGAANNAQEGRTSRDRSAEKSGSPESKRAGRDDQGRSTPGESRASKDRSGDKSEGSEGKRADHGEQGSNKSAKSKEEQPANSRVSQDKSGGEKSTETNKQSSSEKMDHNGNEAGKGKSAEKSAEGPTAAGKAKQVELSGDKRSKVQTAFRGAGNVKHRTHVDIDIAVGRRLPRDWDYVAVPDSVVEIVPEYHGFRFAYVGDEYVIVDPASYDVVAVIPAERGYAESSGRKSGGSQCSTQLSLGSHERELILDKVHGGRESDVSDISVGSQVPRGVELLRFPESVTAEMSELQGCQYFAAHDRIAIVDPGREKIVAVIDKRS